MDPIEISKHYKPGLFVCFFILENQLLNISAPLLLSILDLLVGKV